MDTYAIPYDSHTVLCAEVTNLVLRCIPLARFPDDGPLRTETFRNIQCDILP